MYGKANCTEQHCQSWRHVLVETLTIIGTTKRWQRPLSKGYRLLSALFSNMRTLKFKGWPTNAFFAVVNQMFGGSSQLTTTAEHSFAVWAVHNDSITARSAVVGSWEEPPNTAHVRRLDATYAHAQCHIFGEFTSGSRISASRSDLLKLPIDGSEKRICRLS